MHKPLNAGLRTGRDRPSRNAVARTRPRAQFGSSTAARNLNGPSSRSKASAGNTARKRSASAVRSVSAVMIRVSRGESATRSCLKRCMQVQIMSRRCQARSATSGAATSEARSAQSSRRLSRAAVAAARLQSSKEQDASREMKRSALCSPLVSPRSGSEGKWTFTPTRRLSNRVSVIS